MFDPSHRLRAFFRTMDGPTTCHPGLWMDRFLGHEHRNEPPKDLAEAVAKASCMRTAAAQLVGSGYVEAYQAQKEEFLRLADQGRAVLFEAKCAGRLIVGLGAKGVIESGLRLEHTWGVPVLPGSSLKGLAATTADQVVADEQWRKRRPSTVTEKRKPPLDFDEMFGATDDHGEVTFHDAWWIPEGNTVPIDPDVMTVHHSKYYQSRGVNPPAPSDMDSPIPVPFVTVHGRFLVVLEGLPEWTSAASEILKIGLAELGIGAKTNAGYGRMSLTPIRSAKQLRLENARFNLENQAKQYRGKGQQESVLKAIERAENEGVSESDIRSALLAMIANHSGPWQQWAKGAPAHPAAKYFLASTPAIVSTSSAPVQVVATPNASATPAITRGRARMVEDPKVKNRFELEIEWNTPAGPMKSKAKPQKYKLVPKDAPWVDSAGQRPWVDVDLTLGSDGEKIENLMVSLAKE